MIKMRKCGFNMTVYIRSSRLYRKLKYLTEDKIGRDITHAEFFEMFVDPALLEVAPDHLRDEYKRLGEKNEKLS